jgi:hypothetical protein
MNRSIGLAIIVAGLAGASPILLQSGVSAGESNNQTGVNFVIPMIEPDWAPNRADGASWISFENTGWQVIGGVGSAVITLPNATPGHPNAIFDQIFTNTAGTSLDGTITVWADDTAGVFLDGVLLMAPNFSQQAGIHCAPIGITCTGQGTTFDFTVAPGDHTFSFEVYQTGAWTYGLMYDGSLTAESSVPEPRAYLLVGTGLAALALFRRILARASRS